MKANIYLLKDKKTGLLHTPMFVRNDAEMRRTIISLPETNFIKMFPDDYVVYCIGYFDNEAPEKEAITLIPEYEETKVTDIIPKGE